MVSRDGKCMARPKCQKWSCQTEPDEPMTWNRYKRARTVCKYVIELSSESKLVSLNFDRANWNRKANLRVKTNAPETGEPGADMTMNNHQKRCDEDEAEDRVVSRVGQSVLMNKRRT
jgi:hypothetical protein